MNECLGPLYVAWQEDHYLIIVVADKSLVDSQWRVDTKFNVVELLETTWSKHSSEDVILLDEDLIKTCYVDSITYTFNIKLDLNFIKWFCM